MKIGVGISVPVLVTVINPKSAIEQPVVIDTLAVNGAGDELAVNANNDTLKVS